MEAACWSHARRKFIVLADIAANARSNASGKQLAIAPLALDAVKRIDAIFVADREINGFAGDERLAARRQRVSAIVIEIARRLGIGMWELLGVEPMEIG